MNILSSFLIVVQQLIFSNAAEINQNYPSFFHIDNSEKFHPIIDENILFESKLNQQKYANRLIEFVEKANAPIDKYHVNKAENKCIVFQKNNKTFFDLDKGRVVDNTDLLSLDCQVLTLKIDDYLWKSKTLKSMNYELLNQLENILINYFDVWNQKLNGSIKIGFWNLPERNTIKIAHVAYDLNNKKKQIYYVNSKVYSGYVDDAHYKLSHLIRKSPVNYGIVSSYYDLDRVHPVTKKLKPHLGTDYAAPEGDPIYSVGEGIITEISSDGNNGNHIRIKHGEKYGSQYLHMKSFKKGISKGDFVDKGQVIGYVGSTGLATDSHVCFRLWYKNRQINHIIHKQRTKMDFDKETINQNKIWFKNIDQKVNVISNGM